MTCMGYQGWFTNNKQITCITICPFMIGFGRTARSERPEHLGKPARVLDIVLMGFGLSLEWEIKNDSSSARTT
jgi:hypothetical protein